MPSELKQKMKRFAVELNELFPGLFDIESPTPLAVGIYWQLTPEVIGSDRHLIPPTLNWLCNRKAYLRECIKDGAVRMNLDGSVAGPVSESQQGYARKRLAERVKKSAAKQPVGE